MICKKNFRIIFHLMVAATIFTLISCTTTIHDAVRKNDIEMVNQLIKDGADINEVERSATALHYAVRNENIDMMKLLISSGANIDARIDYSGWTPLFVAISRNQNV